MNFLDTSAVFEKYEAIYNEGPKYLTKFLILVIEAGRAAWQKRAKIRILSKYFSLIFLR